jgi:methyl-accepting chemotaxis protein
MGPPAARGILDADKSIEIKLICHDIDEEIIKYIKRNVITATILQDPIAQGYDSIIYMFNHLVSGWLPVQPRLLSFMDVVTIENYYEFWDSDTNKLKKTKEMIERKVEPVRKSPAKIKIAVFGQDWNPFFLQIKEGSEEAINLLKNYNADVHWYALNQAKRKVKDIKKDAEALVNKIIKEEYNGIVTIIGHKDIVEYFNKAVSVGIPVTTFNSETIGFLSMLVWLNRTSKELTNMSDELADGSKQINYAMEQISETTQNMVDSIINLTDSAKNGVSSTDHLKNMIENVFKGEKKQMDTVLQSSETSKKMSNLINKFNDRINEMKELQEAVNFSAKKMNEMNKYSKKIKSILEFIEYIAEQTNLLSINASIEATKASNYGKGFKIVANEIKKLADNTGKATSDVSELIKNIQKAIEESNKSMNKSSSEVEIQVATIIEATSDMETLATELLDIMKTVQNVAENNINATDQMKKSSSEMSDIILKTSNISQSNSVAIEQLNATTNEISGQMNEIDKQVNLLANIILVLQGTIAQFTFEKEK